MRARAGAKADTDLAELPPTFLDTYATNNNRPRTVREKERTLDRAILPALGHLRLDAIGVRQIEEYKAARLKAEESNKEGEPPRKRSPKTVNEELAILAKILRVAKDWEILERVPKIQWLKVPPPNFDFFEFEEADRLEGAGDKEADPWGAMIVVALRTGLRMGELRALRWDDCDLVAGRIIVRRSADDKNEVGAPKSGKNREVPLGDDVCQTLKGHRHLRGELVFCNENGSMLTIGQCWRPLHRACTRAGLRKVGWHVLRHTFASHLAMRGVPMKAVQELMGHASLTMTMRYAHLSPDTRREAVRMLDRGHEMGTFWARREVPERKTAPGGS